MQQISDCMSVGDSLAEGYDSPRPMQPITTGFDIISRPIDRPQ